MHEPDSFDEAVSTSQVPSAASEQAERPVVGAVSTEQEPLPMTPHRALTAMVGFCGWDEHGATEPTGQYDGLGWESIARMCMDLARAALPMALLADIHAHKDEYSVEAAYKNFGHLKRNPNLQSDARLSESAQAHSKSEYKRRVALGDETVLPALRSNRNLSERDDLLLTLEAWGHEAASKESMAMIGDLLLRAHAFIASSDAKDSERYRWLRAYAPSLIFEIWDDQSFVVSDENKELAEPALDMLIDTAIKERLQSHVSGGVTGRGLTSENAEGAPGKGDGQVQKKDGAS